MKQKILAFWGTILVVGGFMTVMVPTDVAAAGLENSCGAPTFLGFRPWYAGLCSGDVRGDATTDGASEIVQPTNQDETVKFIWTVILNMLFDVFLAVGYIALGFVVYGGFLYITAQGDPGKALKGQKTLTTAIIGMILTMSATVIVNTAKLVLGIDGNGWKQYEDGSFSSTQVQEVFNWAYTVAGIVAVVFIVKGGFEYVLARGDPGKLQKAMREIIYAVAGLIIVLLAAGITAFVIGAAKEGLTPEV